MLDQDAVIGYVDPVDIVPPIKGIGAQDDESAYDADTVLPVRTPKKKPENDPVPEPLK